MAKRRGHRQRLLWNARYALTGVRCGADEIVHVPESRIAVRRSQRERSELYLGADFGAASRRTTSVAEVSAPRSAGDIEGYELIARSGIEGGELPLERRTWNQALSAELERQGALRAKVGIDAGRTVGLV